MSESRTGNVIKNSGASLAFKLFHILFSFALRTAFLKLLGNEYTGISGLFTDILQVLSLMELGLDTSMVYALYAPLAQNDQRKIAALMKFYKKAFTLIGIIILIVGVGCIPFLNYIVKDVPNIKEDIRLIFLMYILASASSYFLVYRTMILKANQRSRVISKVQIIVEIAESAITILLLFLFRQFFLYLFVHLTATWVKNIYLSRLSTKMYPESFIIHDAELTRDEKKKLIRDIACLTVYTLSGVVINSTDSIFISAFVGTVEVAIVGNFTLLINSVRTTVEQINNSLKASVGNLAATASTEKQEIVFNRINFICFWAACFTTTCLFALLNPFVGDVWLGESYQLPQIVIIVLIANYFIAVMVFPVESFRTANGLFKQGWYRPAIMAILNIILDYFMGRQMGILGIFLATTISRLTTQVWFDPYLVYKYVFKKKTWGYYIKYTIYTLITAISCTVVGLFNSSIPAMNGIVHFILLGIIAIIVPNVLIVLLFRRTKEYEYVVELIKGFLKRVRTR